MHLPHRLSGHYLQNLEMHIGCNRAKEQSWRLETLCISACKGGLKTKCSPRLCRAVLITYNHSARSQKGSTGSGQGGGCPCHLQREPKTALRITPLYLEEGRPLLEQTSLALFSHRRRAAVSSLSAPVPSPHPEKCHLEVTAADLREGGGSSGGLKGK